MSRWWSNFHIVEFYRSGDGVPSIVQSAEVCQCIFKLLDDIAYCLTVITEFLESPDPTNTIQTWSFVLV